MPGWGTWIFPTGDRELLVVSEQGRAGKCEHSGGSAATELLGECWVEMQQSGPLNPLT